MASSTERDRLRQAADMLISPGRPLFSLAIIAFGLETLICARTVGHSLGAQYNVLPVIPWLPAVPSVAFLFGVAWVTCGIGLLFKLTLRLAAMTLGGLLFLCALVLEVPKNAANPGSISLRTIVFEPLAIASLAWLLTVSRVNALARCGRYLLALSLIVFGVDHFLALGFIADLLPGWVPWHLFWVAFFGIALVAAGISFALNTLERWAAAAIGSMFGLWVLTLHLPRVLGLYAIPGASRDPNEWSSLFIAVALWGGFWAIADANRPIGKRLP